MKTIIQHQTQTQKTNCVSTCLAMILNQKADVVTDGFHDQYVAGEKNPSDWLDMHGIRYRMCRTSERNMKPNHAYMVAVPSVNIEGGMHEIVIHVTSDNMAIVYDPNEGRKDRLVYGCFEKGSAIPEGYVNIQSWIPDLEFKVEDVAAMYGIYEPFNGEYLGCDKSTEEV